MKTNIFTFFSIPISFLAIFIGCGINDTDIATNYNGLVIKDYLGLKVNNSWTYLKIDVGYPTDSTIRSVNIVGNVDSIWYLNIKDSTFSITGGNNRQYLDTPIVTIFCDTCIQHIDSYNCLHGYNDNFFRLDTTYSIVATGSLTIDGSTYQYIKKTIREGSNMGWYGVYYLKNIGLIKDVYYSRGPTSGGGTIIILKSFNGIENKTFRCFDTGFNSEILCQ